MRTMLTVFLLTLAACAQTPAEVINGSNHFGYASTKPAKDAAECIAKASKNIAPTLISDVRDGDTKGSYQVTVTSIIGDGGTWMVFNSSPTANGTHIDGYMTSSVLFLGGDEKMANSVAEKCL